MIRRGGAAVKRPAAAGFVGIETALYAAFLAMDLTGAGPSTVPVKYAGILLCVCFALYAALQGGDRLALPALALTALADWFLLVRNDRYAVGVAVFLCVQTVYYLRLRRLGAGSGWPLRAALALLAGAGLYALNLASPLNLLAGLYFSQLLSNTLLAWSVKGKRLTLFALGLTLFVGCDVCVGLTNSGLVPPEVLRFVSVGMWLFYLPSQVLIALSALPEEVSHETE